MGKKKLLYTLINSILCIGLFVISILIYAANIMSAASVGASEQPLLQNALVYLTILFPFIPIISIVSTWIAYYKKSRKYLFAFIVLPWGYGLMVVTNLLLLFILT